MNAAGGVDRVPPAAFGLSLPFCLLSAEEEAAGHVQVVFACVLRIAFLRGCLEAGGVGAIGGDALQRLKVVDLGLDVLLVLGGVVAGQHQVDAGCLVTLQLGDDRIGMARAGDDGMAVVSEMARAAVDFETKKCAALSFLSGTPGGAALAATVPADLVQYFAHVMRIEQKLAYIYGWQTFLNDEDEVDDETVMQLVVLMGVMMGVGSAASSISKFAVSVAQTGVVKTIQRQALTKTAFYPVMKSVLRVIGVNLTKQTFAKTVGKVVPVIGGAVSGGLTYASFKPGAEHLRQYLRALPVSGVNGIPEATSDNSGLGAVVEKAQETAGAIGKSAQNAATAVVDRTASARTALAEGFGKLGSAAKGAAKATGSRFSSRKKKEEEKKGEDPEGASSR